MNSSVNFYVFEYFVHSIFTLPFFKPLSRNGDSISKTNIPREARAFKTLGRGFEKEIEFLELIRLFLGIHFSNFGFKQCPISQFQPQLVLILTTAPQSLEC